MEGVELKRLNPIDPFCATTIRANSNGHNNHTHHLGSRQTYVITVKSISIQPIILQAKILITQAGLLTYPLIEPSRFPSGKEFNKLNSLICDHYGQCGVGFTATGIVPDLHRIPFSPFVTLGP